MRLKRSVENGQVIFRNADTDEIVKTEILDQSKEYFNSQIPSHTSILGSIITIIGVIVLIISVFLILSSFSSTLIGIATLPLGFGAFISSMILFAIAELVHNSQYQTKLLKKILEKGGL